MQPERSSQTGPCHVQERYDEADLATLLSWRPDVDALIEAILALTDPKAAAFRPAVTEDWQAFRELAQDIQRRRNHE